MITKLFKLMLVLQAITIGSCILYFTSLPLNQAVGWVFWSTILFSFIGAAGLLFGISISAIAEWLASKSSSDNNTEKSTRNENTINTVKTLKPEHPGLINKQRMPVTFNNWEKAG